MKAIGLAVLEVGLFVVLAFFGTKFLLYLKPTIAFMPDDQYFGNVLFGVLVMHCVSVMLKMTYLKRISFRELLIFIGPVVLLWITWQATRGSFLVVITVASWYLWEEVLDRRKKLRDLRNEYIVNQTFNP